MGFHLSTADALTAYKNAVDYVFQGAKIAYSIPWLVTWRLHTTLRHSIISGYPQVGFKVGLHFQHILRNCSKRCYVKMISMIVVCVNTATTEMLVDMVGKLSDPRVALVHQMPFVADQRGLPSAVEKVDDR